MTELHQAKDYRSFLKLAIELTKKSDPKFGYSELSRKAGLKSRSYPREVILGKKNLSLSTAESISNGLNLKGDLRTLFLLLVESEDPNVKNKGSSPDHIDKKIDKLRNRIHQMNSDLHNQKEIFYKNSDWVLIRASISEKKEGTSLQSISKITGFDETRCEKALAEMTAADVISRNAENGLYHVDSQHMILHNLRNNGFFKSWFIESIEESRKKAETQFEVEDHLFLNSVILVNSSQMKQLKSDLINVVLKYIDDAEVSDGDKLAKITLAFH